jgi:hypothetical protein
MESHPIIEDISVLVNCAPEILYVAADIDKNFVELPDVGEFYAPSPNELGVVTPKFLTPGSESFGQTTITAVDQGRCVHGAMNSEPAGILCVRKWRHHSEVQPVAYQRENYRRLSLEGWQHANTCFPA